MSVGLPNCKLYIGEHYDRDHYNSDYKVGIEVAQEDRIRLRLHIAMMEEVSSFEAILANFDKKYIQTYPIAVKDLVRIFVGRGSTLPQIFQGKVEETDAESEAMENYLTLKGRCIGEDLYRRLVTELYENKKGEHVVKDLIDNYSRLFHVRDGVELIENTDTTYTELEYDKTKLKDVLDFIAKTADKSGVIGYDYRIEYDAKFAFFPRNTKISPISLTDAIKYSNYRKTVHRIRNRIYVYGAAEKGVPYDKDAWTESLTPSDGSWSSGTGTGSVSLDSTQKIKGSYSIKHTTGGAGDIYGAAVFTLNSDKLLDSNKFPKLTFQIRLEDIAALSGDVQVVLNDVNNNRVWKIFKAGKKSEWSLYTFSVGRKNRDEWTYDLFNTTDFEWDKIKRADFIAYFSPSGTGSFWIDNLFFSGRYGVSSPHEGCTVAIPQESITEATDVRELVEVDEELHSDDECVARAKALLNWLKDPAESITLQTEILDFGNNRLQPGDKTLVNLPNENINDYYRILTVDYQLGETQELPITIEVGKEPLLLADYIYRLRKETETMARLKAGM